jgi:hypothetical protein
MKGWVSRAFMAAISVPSICKTRRGVVCLSMTFRATYSPLAGGREGGREGEKGRGS